MSSSPPTDAELNSRLLAGDGDAFEEIIRRHRSAVFGYLRARVLRADDADDLLQEVFLRYYASCGRCDPEGNARGWLIGIARNLLREHMRAIRRRKEVGWTELCVQLESEASDEPAGTGDEVDLSGCLENLGSTAREAIDLKYRSNWKLARIGEKLRRSEGAVKLLVFRAREALRSCLEHREKRCTPILQPDSDRSIPAEDESAPTTS